MLNNKQLAAKLLELQINDCVNVKDKMSSKHSCADIYR